MSIPDKKLGQILIEKGLITERQLEDALRRQKLTSHMLGQTLVESCYINEEKLLEVLTIQGIIEEEQKENSDEPKKVDMFDISLPYFEVPDFTSPDVSIIIEAVNDVSGLGYCPLGGCALFRQPDETDEQLAERAAQAIKADLLRLLKEHPKGEFDAITAQAKELLRKSRGEDKPGDQS